MNPRVIVNPVTPEDAPPTEADLVVIGGGIIGVSTAYFAAKAGHRVCLCEKGEIAGEQSSRNWGWVRQMGRDPAEMPLSIESLRIWRRFFSDHGIDTGYRETGISYLCNTKREVDNAEAWARTGAENNLSQKFLRGEEIANLLPGLATRFPVALHTMSDGRAEPAIAAPAIANAAQKIGAKILTNCAVRGIETEGGRICAVVTENSTIKCSAVVVAAGVWSRLFLGNLGVDFPQLKIRASAARIAAVPGVPDMPVGAGDFGFRKRLDGGFTVALRNTSVAPVIPDSFRLFPQFLPTLVTSWREIRLRFGRQFFDEIQMPRSWALDEVTSFEKIRVLDPEPNYALNNRALKNLSRAFPAFSHSRITHNWGGMIDATPDAIPVIGPIKAIPGLFISSGYSGHGFGIGPGAGKLTVQLVFNETPVVDPKPFRPERFGAPGTQGKRRVFS